MNLLYFYSFNLLEVLHKHSSAMTELFNLNLHIAISLHSIGQDRLYIQSLHIDNSILIKCIHPPFLQFIFLMHNLTIFVLKITKQNYKIQEKHINQCKYEEKRNVT